MNDKRKMVDREPTEAMMQAVGRGPLMPLAIKAVWYAMYDAAPAAQDECKVVPRERVEQFIEEIHAAEGDYGIGLAITRMEQFLDGDLDSQLQKWSDRKAATPGDPKNVINKDNPEWGAFMQHEEWLENSPNTIDDRDDKEST